MKDCPRLSPAERTAYDKILSFLCVSRFHPNRKPALHRRVHHRQRGEPLPVHPDLSGSVCTAKATATCSTPSAPPTRRDEILYQWKTDEHLLRRNTFIGDLYNRFQQKRPLTLLKVMMANYILEGVYFYSGFAFFYNLSRGGKMPGSAQEIRYINRDENTHLWLFRNILLELQKSSLSCSAPENVQLLREMLEEGVRQEIAWGHYVIGDEVPGLNRRMLTDYIRYLGNLRWSGLGYGALYEDNRQGSPPAWPGSASIPTRTWSRPISSRPKAPPTPKAPPWWTICNACARTNTPPRIFRSGRRALYFTSGQVIRALPSPGCGPQPCAICPAGRGAFPLPFWGQRSRRSSTNG